MTPTTGAVYNELLALHWQSHGKGASAAEIAAAGRWPLGAVRARLVDLARRDAVTVGRPMVRVAFGQPWPVLAPTPGGEQ